MTNKLLFVKNNIMSLILSNEFQIEQTLDTKLKFFARNNIVWGITISGFPILIFFENPQNPRTHLFSEITKCTDIDIDSTGRYCCAISSQGTYILDLKTFSSFKITDSDIAATAWASPSNSPVPYIFLATAQGSVSYFSIESGNSTETPLRELNFVGVQSMHISQISGERYVLASIYLSLGKRNPVYKHYIYDLVYSSIDAKFSIQGQNQKELDRDAPCITEDPSMMKGIVNTDYFSAVTLNISPFITLYFYVDPRSNQNSTFGKHKPIQDTIDTDVEPKQKQNIRDYVLIQTGKQISIFKIPGKVPIATLEIDNDEIFTVDQATYNLITVKEQKYKIYKFSEKYDGIQGFFVSMFNTTKDDSHLDTEFFSPSMLLDIAESDMQKVNLLTNYIDKQNASQRMKLLLSNQALFIYIQYLCDHNTEEECKKFEEWAQNMIKQRFLSASNVEARVSQYGFDVNIHDVSKATVMFDSALDKGDIDEAVKLLDTVPRDDFANCALRIADKRMADVCRAMFSRKLFDKSELIPVLISDCAVQYLPQFLERNTLQIDWQTNVFAILLTKAKPEVRAQLSKKFIEILKDPAKTDSYDFAVRYWLQHDLTDLAADAMFARGDVRGAALINPNSSLNAVLSTKDTAKRREMARALLGSLPKEDSQAQALKILQDKTKDVGLHALLSFVPDDTKLKLLVKPTDDFLTEMDKKIATDESSRTSAKEGIQEAHKLLQKAVDGRTKQVLAASCPCNICQQSLFKGKCVLFKCGHSFHIDCIKKYTTELGVVENFDCASCCAFCAFPAPSTVDAPIKNDESEWSTSTPESKPASGSRLAAFDIVKNKLLNK